MNQITPARGLIVVSAVAALAVILYFGFSRPEDSATKFGPVTLRNCQLIDEGTAVSISLEAKNATTRTVEYAVDVSVFYDSPGEAEAQIGGGTFQLGPADPDMVAAIDGEIDISSGDMVDTYGFKCAIVDVRER